MNFNEPSYMRAIIDWKTEAKALFLTRNVLLLEERTRGLLKGLLKVQKQVNLLPLSSFHKALNRLT